MLLFGCSAEEDSMERALALRNRMQAADGCSFDATVTSDYGAYLHSFVLRCQTDAAGTVRFEVIAPDTISGITGTIEKDRGKLTFDEEVLAFSPLADGQLAPVTAPWILIRTLLGGYITSCGDSGNGLQLFIDDSYADNALTLEICLDEQDLPRTAEIIWRGRRILTMQIENFQML